MKLRSLFGIVGLAALSLPVWAKSGGPVMLPIPPVAHIHNSSPIWWSIGGHFIVQAQASRNGNSPIMRTEMWDGRVVQLLSRIQVPPMSASDCKAVGNVVEVRGYYLMQASPADARAAHMSQDALAKMWAKSVGVALPAIAPLPSRYGL